MPVPAPALKYLIDGIEATPEVLAALLADVDWDSKPEPGRFSAREMIAHVADWDVIWLQRLQRTREEDNPFLPSVDEGQVAAERNYAGQDPSANLDRLGKTRPLIVGFLRTLPEDAWDRTAHREFIGDLTLLQLAMTILGHDAYHIRQSTTFAKK